MVRALAFDFNGVLVDDEPLHFRLLRRVLAEDGIALPEDGLETYLGRTDRDCLRTILAARGESADGARIERWLARKTAYYQDEARRGGAPWYPGAAQLVRDAALAGWPLAIVSGAQGGEIEAGLRQEGLSDRFLTVIAAEDVIAGKPDPEGYRKAVEALANASAGGRLIHPHEVIAIEDSRPGIEAASAAGLSTLAVAHSLPLARLGDADRVVARIGALDPERIAALFAAVG